MEIDRSLVEKYTKNLESFISLGYSRPYDENGIKGWYISGFSCTSPVHKAGFRRGDVLLNVNGKNTRSWVGVFMMYQRLKNKEDFEVHLIRKGAPLTLRFRVVEG
jgi:type II secretory pathway component PulC